MNKEQSHDETIQATINQILSQVDFTENRDVTIIAIVQGIQAEVTINALKKELAEDMIIEHGVNGSNHHSCPACHGYIVSMLIFTGVNNCPHCGKAVRYTPDKVEQFAMQMALDSGIMGGSK